MMSDEAKDVEAELERIQQIAIDHAVQEMDASNERGIESREDRGDRGFLTGMAAKSLGVAVRIEQFLILRRREGYSSANEDEASEQAAKLEMVRKARGEVAKILERVGSGGKRS